MTHKLATVTLASAVASAGNITVNYPDGTSAGSFAAYGHKMFSRGLQRMFTQDDGGISVAFGASSITVTYNGSTSIPADTVCRFELNIAGDADAPESLVAPKRISYAGTALLDLGTPDEADANGIVESQDLTALGVYSTLAFNGVYGDPYGNAKAVLDVPRNIVAAWTTTAVLTVTGKDEHGDVIVESSASGESFTGKKAFKEVTSISASVDITGLTVGTGNVLGLPVYVDQASRILSELKDGVALPRKPGIVYLMDHALEAAVDAGTGLNMVSPVNGTIRKMTTIARAAITTGGAVTLNNVTTPVDGLSVVIASAAAEGEVDSDTPTAGHATTVVSVGTRLEVVFASALDSAADLLVIIEIELTGDQVIDGTFVAGVQTAPTATTGDVKGTYAPATVPDGSTAYSLLVALPDPEYKGVDNYDG